VDISTVKLVASDLDGTLLAPTHELSARTIAALQAVNSQGVEIVAVTGRSHWSAVDILKPVDCLRWIICSNGATVYDTTVDRVVHKRPLPQNQIAEIVGRLRFEFPQLGLAWESDHGVHNTDQWYQNRCLTDARFRVPDDKATRDFDPENDKALKLMINHHELTTYQWLAAVEPLIACDVSVSTSGAAFVEITHREANKGDSLRLLCDQLGVAQGETVGFGDHSNDLPMLGWVGRSFAMENGASIIQQAADDIAPHNKDDGVAQILERYWAIDRVG